MKGLIFRLAIVSAFFMLFGGPGYVAADEFTMGTEVENVAVEPTVDQNYLRTGEVRLSEGIQTVARPNSEEQARMREIIDLEFQNEYFRLKIEDLERELSVMASRADR